MRLIIPVALAIACPVGMCLVPMLLMRRKPKPVAEHGSGAQEESKEILLLREEIAALRGEIRERDAAKRSTQ